MFGVAMILAVVAVACGLIAGDLAIIEAAAHAHHHNAASVLGAVAGAFALDAVVLFLLGFLIDPPV